MNYFQQIYQDSRPPAWANDRGLAKSQTGHGNPAPIDAASDGESHSPLPLSAETTFAQAQRSSGPANIYPTSGPASDDEAVLEGDVRPIFGAKAKAATSEGLEIGSPAVAVPVSTPVQTRSSAPENAGLAEGVSPSRPAAAVYPPVNKGSEEQPLASEFHVDPVDGADRKKDRPRQMGHELEAPSWERDLASDERRPEQGNVPGHEPFRASTVKAAQDPVVIELDDFAAADRRKEAHMRSEPAPPPRVAAVSEESRGRSAWVPEYDPRFIGYAPDPDRSTEATAPGAPLAPQVRIGQVDVIIQSPTPPRRATTGGAGSDGKVSPWYLRTL